VLVFASAEERPGSWVDPGGSCVCMQLSWGSCGDVSGA
jgi:hypothetical protein